MSQNRLVSLATLLCMSALVGCQSVTPSLDSIIPTGKSVSGEVQWSFAAAAGDVVMLELADAAGVMVAQELLATPGSKHVPFELTPSKTDLTRCRSGGSCRYSAQLLQGEKVKAKGSIYYTATSQPSIVLETVGPVPGVSPELPKPVYQ